MITFAFQLKTQPQIVSFRHLLLVVLTCALLTSAVGCQDSAVQPVTSGDLESDRLGFGNSGIVASMDSARRSDIPADGQLVGGMPNVDRKDDVANRNRLLETASGLLNEVQAEIDDSRAESDVGVAAQKLLEQLEDPSVAPEIRETLQRIRLLRGTEIEATGAAELEVRRRRNFRIIDLATRTLPVAMSSSDGENAFLQLIRFLLEARLELAVSGNADDIESLYADVKALAQRDPDSKTAAEGIYTLARFAHEMARRNGDVEPIWFDNFCQWAREFANRFPGQSQRATALLLGSARSCELRALERSQDERSDQLMLLATENYRQLVSQFADSIEANEATAVLRRLSLPGQKLTQFSGQTLDSQTIDGRSFVDIVTVIYFWDPNDPEFRTDLLPLLQQASDVADGQLRFVGVSLTDDQYEFSEFLQRHQVPGLQVFGNDPDHRGWDHPLVRFWGLSRGSTCWLIQRDRTVAAVDVTARNLVSEMRALFPPSQINAVESSDR